MSTKQCTACLEEKPIEGFYMKDKQKQRRATVCKECDKERIRMRYLQSKFDLSYDDYCEMERSQGGVCASCGRFETHRRGQRLCVDHNHETGEVRGLLCHHCNTALGLLYDDPERILNLHSYSILHDRRQHS